MVLRCGVALQLIGGGLALFGGFGQFALIGYGLGCVIALLLAAGFWTPLASLTLAALELSSLLLVEGSFVGGHASRLLAGVSLTMLGPGAWSVDALLFGRRRIDLTAVRRPPEE